MGEKKEGEEIRNERQMNECGCCVNNVVNQTL